jgi:hypothetical protein
MRADLTSPPVMEVEIKGIIAILDLGKVLIETLKAVPP